MKVEPDDADYIKNAELRQWQRETPGSWFSAIPWAEPPSEVARKRRAPSLTKADMP